MTERRWSVVTVTYNSAETLRRCWHSESRPYEWIVVDNCSTDDSVQVAEKLGARVIQLAENVGFAKANNIGLREAGEYVLFANPDLELRPDGLTVLKRHLDVHGGLVAPQLLSAEGIPQPNGRGFPYATAKLGNRRVWPLNRLHGSYRILAGPGESVYVAWVMGAAVAARTAEFVELGGWDERFFLYYEDHELGLRSWQLGRPVVLLGDVRWTHHWARATNSLHWSRAHNLELRSARTFFGIFPEFLIGLPPASRRHRTAARLIGSPVDAEPGVQRCQPPR
ncbi:MULTISPECIES: glycosyltransferase family 2 protein [unclassified Micromonospora]|uniref:glycosyltransferase family 2 protein n=1 Tax=unclassified Micromonospora TaxID=2617518 RepID=UPI0022B651A0|nr:MULTISPECIES: glycosyltransferase family 2 protein [unclassified Micromonospora]MCZ7420623.1 glycosyltransferase family 2 protein [Verrucosispora sp. WMMA2121]WBB88920.1 glycosyltransferase family 2 protein [Verrucosispora sp. WMMC514]